MGPMRNGVSDRAYQWKDAGTLADPTWTGNGWAQAADYDAAGNLEQINIVRSGACTNGTNNCDLRFYYYYDEIGRLYRGTRYEGTTLKADLSFIYDSSDNRVIKTDNTLPGTTNDAHTLYVFDSLELRRTSHDPVNETYVRTVENEVPYLIANGVRVGRIVYEGTADGEPRLDGSSPLHVFLNVGDHLGSTSIVVDRATSELVESTTYQPYGATESDYRPARWKGFREDYRFTGKEEEQEIGVTYFGKRFLSPYLGRWVTPDPLAVHVPGEADLNLYAYVHGRLLTSIDPIGLDDVTYGFLMEMVQRKGTTWNRGAAGRSRIQDIIFDVAHRVETESRRPTGYGEVCSQACFVKSGRVPGKPLAGTLHIPAEAFADARQVRWNARPSSNEKAFLSRTIIFHEVFHAFASINKDAQRHIERFANSVSDKVRHSERFAHEAFADYFSVRVAMRERFENKIAWLSSNKQLDAVALQQLKTDWETTSAELHGVSFGYDVTASGGQSRMNLPGLDVESRNWLDQTAGVYDDWDRTFGGPARTAPKAAGQTPSKK